MLTRRWILIHKKPMDSGWAINVKSPLKYSQMLMILHTMKPTFNQSFVYDQCKTMLKNQSLANVWETLMFQRQAPSILSTLGEG